MSAADPRFARQVLLSEIGRRGQETLSAARYRIDEGADPRVAHVVRTYLDRAGLAEHAEGRVVALDERGARDPAAAFLAGALAAVEHIKSELGIGTPMSKQVG